MNILRRRVLAPEQATQKIPPEAAVNRRIEVTVERETVTMLVRPPAAKNQDASAPASAGPESQLLLLPAADLDCK